MRTVEKFKRVYGEMEWFLKMHNRPVWLVATDDDYYIDIIEPNGDNLPFGTCAIEYGKDDSGISPTGGRVESTKTL